MLLPHSQDVADRCSRDEANPPKSMHVDPRLASHRLAFEMSLPIASGAMLAAAFMQPPYYVLAWIALIPFGVAMSLARPSFQLYLSAYLGGAIFHLHALEWFRTRYGAEGFANSQAADWLLNGMLWAFLWPLMLFLGRRFLSATRLPIALAFPIIWISGEFLRLELGRVIAQTPFPWVQVGATQAPVLSLIQVADLGGVWAVTALVAMVNGAWCDVLVFRRWRPAVAAVLLMAIAWLYGEFRLHQSATVPGPTVALVPCWVQPSAATEGFPGADLLLWSETAYHEVPGEEGDKAIRTLEQCSRRTGSLLTIGSYRRAGGRKYNSSIVVDPRRGYLGCYDKRYLVPWGEFTPWGLGRARQLSHGQSQPTFPLRGREFAPSICYDICFDRLYRSYIRKPDFYVVSSCESTDGTGYVARSLLDMTRFRAIENRRAFVRNVQSGFSGIIDSDGRLVATPGNSWYSPVSLGPVPIDDRRSLYAATGNWLPILCCICVAVGLAGSKNARKSTQKVSAPARV
jgi:apolipoprotein N-acyltransferase